MSNTMWTETIRCQCCGKTAEATVRAPVLRWWYELPAGWLVADTYPPGDDGLQFMCSTDCLYKSAGGEM